MPIQKKDIVYLLILIVLLLLLWLVQESRNRTRQIEQKLRETTTLR